MKNSLRFFVCVLGLILSVYAFYVEHVKLNDAKYEALCDINSMISCSVVFTSKYGKGFGFVESILGKHHFLNQPNSVFGILFFILQMAGIFWFADQGITGVIVNRKIVFEVLYWMTFASIFMCLYLAYILAFILHDFCIVCVGTYILTFVLHFLNYRTRKRFKFSRKRD